MEFYEYDSEESERAALYKLFSDLFMKEPAEETLVEMKEMFQMKFDDSSEEIRRDFTSLFLGKDLHLSPYESLYNYPLGDTPRLWGRATEEVQALYRAAGLMIDEEIDLIPDHVSVELLFMSYLVENGFIEKQRVFMEEHLHRWIPDYCDEVRKHAGTTFYKEVADLLREFLATDLEELSGE